MVGGQLILAAHSVVRDGARSRGKTIEWALLNGGRATEPVVTVDGDGIAASEQDVLRQTCKLLDIEFGLSAIADIRHPGLKLPRHLVRELGLVVEIERPLVAAPRLSVPSAEYCPLR